MPLPSRALAGAVVAGALTAVTAYAGPASAAAATTTTEAAPAAAGWLAGRLVGANHLTSSYTGSDGNEVTYDDYGLTADAVLALDAAGVAQDAAGRATSWLGAHVTDYAGSAPNYYPGSLAKLILVAVAQGANPHDFGPAHTDLVAALTDEENADGLYDDPDAKNGYESVVTQAVALVALSRTDTRPDAQAVAWLVGQQCPDGGFQTDVRTDTSAACSSESDTTAFAVQALAATGTDSARAVGWLLAHRNTDNGFGAPASNANSTAVAVQALVAAGRTPSASVAYLQGLQMGCDAPAEQQGAVTYAGRYDTTAVRATAQAAAGLAQQPLATITATGAQADAPALACPAAAPAPSPSATPVAAPAATATPALPYTGPRPAAGAVAAGGAGALLVGAGLMLAARRRAG